MTARIERVSSAAPAGPGAQVNTWIIGDDEEVIVIDPGHGLASGPVPHDGEFPDFAGQLTAIGEHLLTLPPGSRVLPGQGPETTIGTAEKQFDSWVSAGPVLPG
jgi:hypothetical protein